MHELLRIGLPITLMQFVSSLQLVVNAVTVAVFAPEHVATLGGANGVFLFVQLVMVTVLFAGDGFIAQAVGAADRRRTEEIVRSFLWFGLGVCAVPVVGAILAWMALRGSRFDDVARYIALMSVSLPFYVAILVLQKFWTAHGAAKQFFYFSIFALVMNAFGDLLFIHPAARLELGADGVAAATILMRVLTLAIALWFTVKRESIHVVRRFVEPRASRAIVRQLAKLGMSTGLNGVLDSGTVLLLSLGALYFGTSAMEINQYAMTLGLALFPLYWGISSAATVLVGRAIGAGDRDSAQGIASNAMRLGLMAGVGVACVLCVFVALNAGRLDAPMSLALLCVAGYQWADAIQVVASGVLRASNIGVPQVYANAISFYVLGPVYFGVMLLLGLGFGAVWSAFSLSIISTGVIHYVLYLRWRRGQLVVSEAVSYA